MEKRKGGDHFRIGLATGFPWRECFHILAADKKNCNELKRMQRGSTRRRNNISAMRFNRVLREWSQRGSFVGNSE